jgi:two-component system response regulator RegX3
MSRQQILDGVWGHDWYGDMRTVDVHMAQVRKKIGDACAITTVRGVGYRLEASRAEPAP